MATLYVKKDGSGHATTIQQGIQLAAIGDIVEIEAGTFDENIDLWKGVTLKGAGIDQTIITGALRSVPASKTFTWALGDTLLTVSSGDTSGYEVGWLVSATGIPANARIASKTSTTLTISDVTTQAAATARAVAVGFVNDAAINVRGTSGIIRDLKAVGFDSPNAAIEFSALYFRQAGFGSSAASGWEIFNCEFVANGDLAVLSEYSSAIGNLNFHENIISGKTFMGANPATGNQFSVWNVPRPLVTLHIVNVNVIFQNNQISGVTGGLTTGGVASFNTAITIDPVGSVITGNEIDVVSGYGYGLRARGLNSDVQNNSLVGTTAGYYILPNHATGVSVSVGAMVFNSSKYWICIQAHTSSSTNAPTGAQGSLHWSEITISQVNASGVYGVAIPIVGTNDNFIEVLINISQGSSGESFEVSITKNILKNIAAVSSDPVFSNEANWELVGVVYKKDSKRMTSGFRSDFSSSNAMKLKGAMPSEFFQLHKIIISKSDRSLKVINRSEIPKANRFDVTLK